MPKFIVAVFMGIFLLGGTLGLGFGSEVKALAAHNARPVAPSSQVNFLLVRINDRTLDHPQLISVWGIFINRSQFPSLFMKRIFPEPGSDESVKIGQAFSLTATKEPTTGFAEALNSLDLPSPRILVVDDSVLPDWVSALAGASILKASTFPTPDMNLHLAQQLDQQLLNKACSSVDHRSQPIVLETANPGQGFILSDTLKSSDNLQQWKGLVTSLHFTSCESLVSP
jgi:hypothetical protein